MENILLMLLIIVAILILTEIYELNMKIRRLERALRIERIKGHIKDVELISKDITDMLYEIKVSCKNLQIEVKE